MATVFGRNVPSEPEGPQALPGSYQVRLTVDGKSYSQPFTLAMDPRVKATADDLQKQFALETKLAQAMQAAGQATREIHEAKAAGRIGEDVERKLAGGGRRGAEDDGSGGDQEQQPTLAQLSGSLSQLLGVADSADAAPTAQLLHAADQTLAQLQLLLAEWRQVKSK